MRKDYFAKYNVKEIDSNIFMYHYILDDADFYIERVFMTKLDNLFFIHKDKEDIVIEEMIRVVKKNQHVLFCGDYETVQADLADEYIYLEIEDILNPLQIFVEDKSRGSDYGD